MTVSDNINLTEKFQVGDIIFYQEKDWIIAEIADDIVTIHRDKIDGQSYSLKISKIDLREKLKN